jgi:cytochrome c oxidase subunit 2
VHGNRRLELIWTTTPAVILAVVFVFVLQTMREVDAAPPDAQRLRVIGHQYWWEFQYPDQQVFAANELHVPVGVPLMVQLESVDVIHSFWVPHFVRMRDTVPGKVNQMPVLVDRAGIYDGSCNQFCGMQHAWMRSRVVAEAPDQFQTWAQQQAAPVTRGNSRGEQVYLQNTCVSCHTIRGLNTSPNVGPDLTHVGSRAQLAGGVIDNSPEALRRWIRDPSKLKPGVLMPAYPNLADQDLADLVDYLASLR